MKALDMARPRTPFVVALIIAALVAMWYFWPGVQRQAEVIQSVAQVVSQEPASAPVQETVITPIAEKAYEEKLAEVKSEAMKQASKPAVEKRYYTVKPGDGLERRFGKNMAKVCELNKLKDCNRIYSGQELLVPDDMEIVAYKPVQRLADGSLPIARLAVDPYRPHRTPEKDRKILASRGYTPAEIEEYLMLRDQGKCVREEFPRDTKFPWMSSGNARVLENLVAVWKQPEVGSLCQLQSGRNVVIMKKCDNLTEAAPRPPKTIAPPPVEPRLPPKEETPGEPETPKAVVTARYDPDYDLGLYAGADPDVVFAGFDGAYYPWLDHVSAGRHAFGIGAKGDWWDGRTHTGFHYDGYTLAYGPAYKWSDKTRRDLNLKLLYGRVKENGHQGEYESDQMYRAVCLASNYTDASRERDGKTVLPEWTFWMSYCQLKAKSYGHTWQGQSIADTSALGKSTALISIGTRIYLHRNLETAGVASGDAARKLQPFVELGANQEVPMDPSGHVYLGVRTTDKLWTFGAGAHIGHEGTVPGAGITYDAGRKIHMEVKDARWQEMHQAFEAAGISID